MKHSKILAFTLAVAVYSIAFAQDNSATSQANAQIATASADSQKDRSYTDDYVSKKASVVYIVEGKENPATFKEIVGKSVVFADSTGSDMTVEHGSANFKFSLKIDVSTWRSARALAQKGDFENAIKAMRDIVYPAIPLAALSKDAFDASEYIEPFVSSLIETNRLVEAYAFAKALPIEITNADVIKSAMDVAYTLS
ncbi:MAG: hypothetical protein J6B07_03415, partial [Opitutales bacterium]|nr:hypothetical protein [Opitutales bacterium]